MIYRFTEVLNDLVNYFLLGDILLLEDWKQANHLSDDLTMEFTTNESGDRVFDEGIVIPMAGIENYGKSHGKAVRQLAGTEFR